MSLALIQAAIQAGHDKDTDDAALVAAQTADAAAATALTKAAQDLHDALAALPNKEELYIDSSTTPPTYYVYAAVDPGSYSATVIPVAT